MTAPRQYRIDETLEIEETGAHEFKGFQHVAPNDVIRTICDWTKEYANAFLNGEGGTLYFSVEDDGTVTGVKLERKERDDVRHRIGQIIKEFYPAVDPSLWQVDSLCGVVISTAWSPSPFLSIGPYARSPTQSATESDFGDCSVR